MFSSRPSTWLCRRSNCTNCTLRHLSSDSVLWGTAEAVTGPSYSSLSDDCPRGYDGNHRTVLLNMRRACCCSISIYLQFKVTALNVEYKLTSAMSCKNADGHTLVLLPGLFSGELPECTQELMIDVTKSYYQKFLPLTQV